MVPLVEAYQGELIPSRAFAEGGIHEAIMAYEDTMFFEILAQELALRDMDSDAPTPENVDELRERGVRAVLGNAANEEIMNLAHLDCARWLLFCKTKPFAKTKGRTAVYLDVFWADFLLTEG